MNNWNKKENCFFPMYTRNSLLSVEPVLLLEIKLFSHDMFGLSRLIHILVNETSFNNMLCVVWGERGGVVI